MTFTTNLPLRLMLILGLFACQNLTAQTYCPSKGNLPWTEWIASVKLGTINNASNKEGYGDFTSQTTNLTQGTSYPLSITQGFSYAPDPANATQQGRVWIDYNKNGTFEAAELVASFTRTTTTANVVVPTTALTGATRMRVSLKTIGTPTACEVFDKGEVEDYMVNIQGGTTQSCANNALNFDGVNDQVVSSRTVIPANADFTLEASFISTATSTGCSGAFRRLLVFDLGSSLNRFEIGDCAGQLTLYYYFGNVDELVNIPNATTLRNGNWHHVSVVKQGTNLMIYYDGTLVLTRPNMGGVNPVARQLIVGSWVQPIENWEGSIDEVKVWNYAMTASEVQNKRLCQPTGTEANLLLYYPFNQGASSGDNTAITTVLDKSLSANNGTLRNFTLTGSSSNFICSNLAVAPCVVVVNNSCRYQDSLQLVSLYNATNGAFWVTKWELNTPINTWYGVTLDANGCVSNIKIDNNYLNGTVPNLNLPNLQTLELPNNPITSNIPNFNLPNLTRLDFFNCKLLGAIPNFNLPKLQFLILNLNKFTGAIPNFNYPNLQTIALSGNQLTGTIPNFNVPKLQILFLSDNQLSGTIPNLNAPLISSFLVANNQLSGCLPAFLKNMCNIYSTVNIGGNPSLATQDFAAFCANNTGACTLTPTVDLTLTPLKFQDRRLDPIKYPGALVQGSTYGGPNQTDLYTVTPASITVTNVPVAGFNTKIKAYISTDSLLDANDIFLSEAIQPISRNDINSTTFSLIGRYNIGAGQIPTNIPIGNYFMLFKIDADNAVLETNEGNNVAVMPVKIIALPVEAANDMAVTISATPSVYRIYTPHTFRVTVVNNGNAPFTDVKLTFDRPANTVSGGTKTVSLGVFQDYCSNGIECSQWTIPSLAAGATATLDAPVFILAPTGSITAKATYFSSTPYDVNILNNSATVTVNPATAAQAPTSQALAFRVPTQLIPVIIQRISPNPTEGDVQIKLDSWTKQTVDFNFSDITGKTIYSEKRDVEKGVNRLDFEVFHLPQGVYFIQTNVGKGHDVPTKFVKM